MVGHKYTPLHYYEYCIRCMARIEGLEAKFGKHVQVQQEQAAPIHYILGNPPAHLPTCPPTNLPTNQPAHLPNQLVYLPG